jgi:hypothetical protein
MPFPACDRVCPQCDTGGKPEVNRDEPNGSFYIFHEIFLSVFVVWFGRRAARFSLLLHCYRAAGIHDGKRHFMR